ncbi:Nuclear pore complex protein Nup107 [Eumeta japonica]|uniref:Nuclear pore complex protein n=1 Tax=Eumeta variegata TaxID=151549 RepID=A0A4C1V918_EUMVA|nr:Nuclear pore complex protein Nup107 [Eumeta japonica]
MNLDKSLQLHSTYQSPFRNKRSRQILQREDTLNLSPILSDTSLFKTFNDTSLRQVLDETSVLVANTNTGDGLDEMFFEIIQSSKHSNITDTVLRLCQACRDSFEIVEPWNRYNLDNCWLAEEANTWRLLYVLYTDSVSEHPNGLNTLTSEPVLSQQTLVNSLFESDAEVRLLQLLVNWLESSASYQEEATKSSVPVISNNVHWGNTLHQLLVGNSLFNKETNKIMVTCIDPDAPRRQKKVIHSDDQQDDSDLCKKIFTQVRCGKFTEAISLCVSAGQAWRGTVLQGYRLLHYFCEENSITYDISGNPNRDLWKWCCLGIANNQSENIHYRATVGILCGHLPSTLPACQGNWEDLLWAHLKVQVEGKIDKFLKEHHSTVYANTTPSEVLELLQTDFHVEELSLQQIFHAVNALMDGKQESQYQTCQRYLMLGHIRSIIEDSLIWIENTEHKFIRFLAHLILVLRQMGKDPQHDIGNKVLESYVHELIKKLKNGSIDCPELITYYISTVPPESQVLLFADLMDRIEKKECRKEVVRAGVIAGIDIAAAARLAIKKAILAVQEGYGNVHITYTQTSSSENDKSLVNKVITSLEWLALQSNQVQEALWLSNAMIRTFIFINNTDAASETLLSLNNMFPSFVSKVPPNSSELREHLCLKAYIEALDGFTSWYRHFISGQPKEVEPIPSDATFSDKVHHEQRCAQVEQLKARWQNTVTHQSRYTKNLFYNVLKFPGGWLQDDHDGVLSDNFSINEKEERTKQLDTLRRLCIPEIAILMLKILQSNSDIECHKEALKLCDLIAAENRLLYRVFTKEKLMEILERVKESALFLLEKGLDMFGYPLED